jgi:hypothetical protein
MGISMAHDDFAPERAAFAEAVAAYFNDPNNPALSISLHGQDVSIADVCEAIADDEGVMPDDLTRALSLVPPATFAKGASYLKQYIKLPAPGDWIKK